MKNKVSLKSGDKFGRLEVVKLDHTGNHYRSYYLFKCDCGKTKVILGAGVVSGNTKSCGCWATEKRKSRRISKYHSEVTAIILGYKRHARDRGYTFELTKEQIVGIIRRDCYYCATPPSNRKITKNSLSGGLPYNGIDRLDSRGNYTTDNVVACCSFCNRAKNNMVVKDYINKCIKVAEQWGEL